MNIGFVSIYAYRPHVENLFYLSEVISKGGHQASFFVCDASVPKCYSQLLKGHAKWRECPVCMLGGFRSYPARTIYGIEHKFKANLSIQLLENIAKSSAYTINRIETPEDCTSEDVLQTQEQLYDSVQVIYGNVINWINNYGIDGILCFNGRMALTRAVTFACEQLKVPYVTVERTLFGPGLTLIPNANCLSLKEFDEFNKKFSQFPLKSLQAQLAAKFAALRFLKQNVLEWRLYNSDAIHVEWPLLENKSPKVIILPSSRHEFAGHKNFFCEWESITDAIDEILACLDISHSNCILRCHPNWAENIGVNTGYRSERYYTSWASRNGVYCIRSLEKADTYHLMHQADIIIVNGSSCGFEGGILGKKVICIGAARYQEAGFTYQIRRKSELSRLKLLDQHDEKATVRKTLRFIYTCAYRIAQYTRYVSPRSTTRYHYHQGASSDPIVKMLSTGVLPANDPEVADDSFEEDIMVEAILSQQWAKLASLEISEEELPYQQVNRRLGLRWIDNLRDKFPRGDQ